jgi:hypothetical protein
MPIAETVTPVLPSARVGIALLSVVMVFRRGC